MNFKIDNNKCLIGIGESSHGNSIDWDFRRKIIENNIINKDTINVFAEIPANISYLYKLYLKNDIDSSVFYNSLHLYGLKSKEFLNFLSFVNDNDNINLIGIDMQDYRSTIIFLHFKLKENNIVNNNIISLYNKIIKKELISIEEIERVIEFINSNEITNLMTYEFTNINQYLIYKKYNYQNLNKEINYRDSCMAYNIINNYKIGNLGFVLAANYHILNINKNMGFYLLRKYEKSYIKIISQFYEGEYLAVKKENGKWRTTNKIFISPKKTLPYLINKKNINDVCFFLIKNIQLKKNKILIQDFGSGPEGDSKFSGYYYYDLKEIDYVFYNKKAIPVNSLIKNENR